MNKSFEDQWKDALGDTSHTPPPEIWERVEAELDRKKSRFLLWGIPVQKNYFALSGAAAAVVLMLGTLFLVNYEAPQRSVSQKAGTSMEQKPESTEQPDPAGDAESATSAAQRPEAGNNGPAIASVAESVTTEAPRLISLRTPAPAAAHPAEVQREQVAAISIQSPYPSEMGGILSAAYDELDPLPFRKMQAYTAYPRVEAPLNDVPPAVQTRKEKRIWMGVIAANAPFNPNFSAPGFQQQALSAIQSSNALMYFDKTTPGLGGNAMYSNSSRTDAQSSFKTGQSMSIGLSFGRRLKKKLALESGLKFTRATTTHNSNVYALNKATGETESFSHANYVSTQNRMSDVLISVNGTSHYAYHFLSVPLLLNYEVLRLGKLNVNAVGGMSTEFLLSGTVTNSRNQQESFNAGNSNFRPINIAGIGGVRLSYPLTTALDINLGSTYQHFLTSGLQKSTDATFRPSMLGINLGLSVRQ